MYSTLSGLYRIEVVGLDALQLVLVGTALEATVFVFEIPTGIVADVYSRRLSVIIGFALVGAGFALEGLVPSFAAVLAAQVIWGIGYTFTSGALQAWVVDEIGHADGALFLRRAQLGNAASLLGIAVAVALGSASIAAPLVAAGIGMLALACAAAVAMTEAGFEPLPRDQRGSFRAMGRTIAEASRAVAGRPGLGLVLAVAALGGLASEPIDRLADLHFLDTLALPVQSATRAGLGAPVWFGLMQAAILAVSIGATGWIRARWRIDDGPTALWALRWINLTLIGCVVGFALAGSWQLAIPLYVAVQVLRRAAAPIASTWINQRIPSSVRATILSTSSQCDALGQLIGGPALGAFAREYGLRLAFLATAVLLAPIQPLYARVKAATREESAGASASG